MVARIVPTVVLILVLFASLGGIAASQEEKPFKPLTELSKVSIIVVGDLDSDAREAGLSVESLESQALVAIRRDIPSLIVTNDEIPYLRIIVPVLQVKQVKMIDGFAAAVEAKLYRPARILSDDLGHELGFQTVGVWNSGAVLLVGNSQTIAGQVRDAIDSILKQFAADYYRHNP